MKNNKFYGFTLAEVLITLTIIGVIAAITIPNLMKTYQKHVLTTQLKNWYSDFSNVLNNYKISPDYIDDIFYNVGEWTSGYESSAFVKYIDEQLGMDGYTYKDISGKYKQLMLNFWGNQNNKIEYKKLNGEASPYPDEHYYFYINRNYKFKNGAVMGMYYNRTLSQVGTCWQITVDVNGPKTPPNQIGRDTFHFYINEKLQLLPRPSASGDGLSINYCGVWADGKEHYEKQCNPSYTGGGVGSSGVACAERIIRRGWKMDY